jgi:hypothetical protein
LRAWNADTTVFKSLGARLLRNPIAGCCARAASGHAVAAVARQRNEPVPPHFEHGASSLPWRP